jgi:glycosyltransferase involved in cell wall biosynthesis
MKKILFDLYNAQPAGGSKYHGGGEYIKAVFNGLINDYLDSIQLSVFYDKSKFIDDWIIRIIEQKNINVFDIKSLQDLKEVFNKDTFDVLFSGIPYYYSKDIVPASVKFIGTIHGIRLIEKPTDKYAHLYLDGTEKAKEIIKGIATKKYKAKKIAEFTETIDMLDEVVCVSNHTKYSLMTHFNLPQNKPIDVFYTPQKVVNTETSDKSPREYPYILLLGGNRWVKNTYRAILSIDYLFQQGFLKDYKVIIVGQLSKEISNAIKYKDKYEQLGYIETNDLENLYKFADVFVYPSLNEGFGMPPLEAMKYGTTCVVSGVCSLPEICGDAVYYVNPYDIEEIASRILNATQVKIDANKVIMQFNKIYKKQDSDLNKLCELLIS